MISIAFFNNKGGVGKTSLVYHTAWMFAELGHRVLAVDLDPQSNLSIMALDEERLEALWPDDEHPQTLHGAVAPLFGGTGDIRPAHIEAMAGKLGLLVGDLALSRIEDIYNEVNNFYQHNAVRKEVVETRNMAIIALAVIRSALMRKESRGAHFLVDNPERDDRNYKHDTII